MASGIVIANHDFLQKNSKPKMEEKTMGGGVVYTCQKPQTRRCAFFLWSDDAKIREEAAVLSNSRSEPTAPQSPKKTNTTAAMQPTTPTTVRPKTPPSNTIPLREPQSDKTVNFEHEDSFGWSSSADEELHEATVAFETPRKAARTEKVSSPSKRNFADFSDLPKKLQQFSSEKSSVPVTSNRLGGTGLLSPAVTPAKQDSQDLLQAVTAESQLAAEPSALALEALEVLKPANLNTAIEKNLVDLLNKYDLRTQGIIKGREITRIAMQAKEKKITELQARITGLEAERETSRTVIAHLKQDIANSPKRGGRSRGASMATKPNDG